MRYLRTSQDFLFSHLQHLPFILPSEFSVSSFCAVSHCENVNVCVYENTAIVIVFVSLIILPPAFLR